jgi:hypothetical protein
MIVEHLGVAPRIDPTAYVAPDAAGRINWVAVGQPAQSIPPEQHDVISRLLAAAGFRQTVYGVDQETDANDQRSLMTAVAERNSLLFGKHAAGPVLG